MRRSYARRANWLRVRRAHGSGSWPIRAGAARPAQPWLGPDIGERLRAQESRTVVVAPIGFISDHMEVLYDLDIEARALAESSWDNHGARRNR